MGIYYVGAFINVAFYKILPFLLCAMPFYWFMLQKVLYVLDGETGQIRKVVAGDKIFTLATYNFITGDGEYFDDFNEDDFVGLD